MSPLPLLLVLSAGCTSAPGSVGPGAPSPTLTLDADHPTAVRAALPASETRSCTLGWQATDPAGVGESVGLSATPLVTGPDGAQSATLLGIPAAWDVEVGVTCEDPAGGQIVGEPSMITTGSIPSSVPRLVPLQDAPSLDAPYILTSALQFPEGAAITMVTLAGDPVWWQSLGADHVVIHSHFDAEHVLVYGIESTADGLESAFLRAPLVGPAERWIVEHAHHDSLHLGDGRYLLTVGELRAVGGDSVTGDTLVVFDVADASVTVVWSAWDQLEVVENAGWNLRLADGSADWTHMNGLARDADTGKIYASLYYDHSILQIDPTTWQTDWILGGESSDFTLSSSFGPQHSPIHRGASLWMFDNGSDVAAGSRLCEYTLDASALTATLAWEWQPESAPFNIVLGSIEIADDAVLASWGDTGEVRILDLAGEVIGYYDLNVMDQIGNTSFVGVL